MSQRKIAFINEKGGTCKTTLAVNLAAYLALKKGRRVLLVDLDTQGHAAKSLGLDVRGSGLNIFHLLTDPTVTLEQVIRPTAVEGLSIIPSWKEMADLPQRVGAHAEGERLLAKRLTHPTAAGFDRILFDAPPSLGLVSTNILLAATEVVMPVATTFLALDGAAEMSATIEALKTRTGHDALTISMVVPTLYRKSQMADEVLATLKKHFGTKLSEPLSFNVAIDEAQSHGKTIWHYAPWSRGATMLQGLGDRLERARV
jgi:chromosome partitioning protein